MAQFGRPDSDIATGNWTTAPLYSKINEASYDDGTYIQLNNSPSSSCDLGLSNVVDPQVSTGHYVRIRAKKTGTGSITLTGYLMEGSNVRATITITLTTSFNTTTYNLTGAEADSIQNYSDVFLRLTGVANSSSRYIQVSWSEFEVPTYVPTLAVNDAYSVSFVEDTGKLPQVHNLVVADSYCISQVDSVVLGTGAIDLVVQDAYSISQVDVVPYFTTLLKPSADVTDGNWTNESGSQVNLYESINEDNPVSSDYIQSELNPVSSPIVVKLESKPDPQTSIGHAVRYVLRRAPSDGANLNLLVQLRQDYVSEVTMGTLIAEKTETNLEIGETVHELRLTDAQADNITDYGSLYVRFVAVPSNNLLLESGASLLLESGGHLLKEGA